MRTTVRKVLCVLFSCLLISTVYFQMEFVSVPTYAAQESEKKAEKQEEEKKLQEDTLESKQEDIENNDVEENEAYTANRNVEIDTYAASNMKLTKSAQQMFAGYYPNGSYDCKESILYLDGNWVWCMEPSQLVGNVGSGVNYALSNGGDASQWLKNRFGWSWTKTNNLSKAVYLAKKYFPGDGNCTYALIQNLIWSEITSAESPKEAGRYLLTNGAEKTAHVCSHLNTKEKVDAAIKDIWVRVGAYHKMPSYTGTTIHVTAGQSVWIADSNGVSNELNFTCPSGLQITKNHNGIWIRTDQSAAGQSFTANFTKNTIPAGSEGVSIYEATDKKRQAVGLWTNAITPDYGAVRVIVDRTKYLNAKYKAQDAISPAFDIHIEKTDSDTGEALENAVFDIYMDGEKKASVMTDQDGKASYHWRGDALYTDYYEDTQSVTSYNEWNRAYLKAKENVKKKVETAIGELKDQTTHTWKVEERQAPEGYELNDTVWEETIDLNTEAVEIDFTDRAKPGYLNMKKVSENPSITEQNDCYSLDGAEYGVYETVEDARADQNRLETLTTNADGVSETVTLYAGTYYIKEVKAPKGYELCCEKENEQSETGIHVVTVQSNETSTFTCKEKPGDNPFALLLEKLDQRTGTVASGTASVKGAVFELSYYANTEGNTETPIRKWYFRTGEEGKIICNQQEQLISEYRTNQGEVFKSDPFYVNGSGMQVYPIGTYCIREVVAPKYFKKAGYMYFSSDTNNRTDVTKGITAVIRQEHNGGATQIYSGKNVTDGQIEVENLNVKAYDELQYGSVTIYKTTADAAKKPLQGVVFKLKGQTDGVEYQAQTDEEGKVCWKQLIPQDYVITEVKTVDGRSLLKEPVSVTLPMEMTWDELKVKHADLSRAVFDEVSGKYCFYDLTINIGNSVTFDMPMTGRSGKAEYILLISGLSFVIAGIVLGRRKIKNHKQ